MLTPQEVSDKAFVKSAFGGYSMTQVDEFLDVLTADYGVLYTENAVLKSKMKVMVDKVDEYRSTEEAMRKALMTAQRMADETIRAAEEQKTAILAEAEQLAMAKVSAVREERALEEKKLVDAQHAVAQFVAQATATYQRNMELLGDLALLCPAPAAPVEEEVPAPSAQDDMVEDIEENVQRILDQAMADVAAAKEEAPMEAAEEVEVEEPTRILPPIPYEEDLDEEDDLDFSELEFGNNYQNK